MTFILVFISFALVIITGILISNFVFFPKLRKITQLQVAPTVSILIPARNEAKVIGDTLDRLVQSEYKHFEILVLNDNSDDNTGVIAGTIEDTRIRVIDGEKLPDGWLGKNWACHQLAKVSKGDILVFTDADVKWSKNGLGALVTQMVNYDVDLMTVWPTQKSVTLAERLVVPMMALVVLGYLPVVGVHFTHLSAFAAANGQCMAWKRKTYFEIGGHTLVSDNILEDVTLARIVKKHGKRLRMADGAGLISCRMYEDWPTVRDGYAKNILAGYGNSVIFLILATLFHWAVFLIPWVIFIGSFLIETWLPLRIWSLLTIVLGLLIRILTASFTRQRTIDGLLMPLSVVLMTLIAMRSIVWHFSGGPRWKGRKVPTKRKVTENS